VQEVCCQAVRASQAALPPSEPLAKPSRAPQPHLAEKSPEPSALSPCHGSNSSYKPPRQPCQPLHARNSFRHARQRRQARSKPSKNDAHGLGSTPTCSTRQFQPTMQSSLAARKSPSPPASSHRRQSTAITYNARTTSFSSNNSTPIRSGGTVFLTCRTAHRRLLLCTIPF
jgi:hypothetical protein